VRAGGLALGSRRRPIVRRSTTGEAARPAPRQTALSASLSRPIPSGEDPGRGGGSRPEGPLAGPVPPDWAGDSLIFPVSSFWAPTPRMACPGLAFRPTQSRVHLGLSARKSHAEGLSPTEDDCWASPSQQAVCCAIIVFPLAHMPKANDAE